MMSCALKQETLSEVVRFHGHSCPGLSIGIRASELAKRELGDLPDSQMVCITETDMCGVDAVQYLTGCTFGKGNLIHKDYGKMAFTFFDRETGKGFRCLFKPVEKDHEEEQLFSLMREMTSAAADEMEKGRFEELRLLVQKRILEEELDSVFEVTSPKVAMPRGARVLNSLVCDDCGEATMESRTRRFAGKTLCQPCFDKVEQKI
jgi:formylmethanofuran dehydrogenase subunit E